MSFRQAHRLAGAVQPFILLPLLTDYGSKAMFISIIMALMTVDIAPLGPRTTGRSLEDVNATKAYDDTLVAEIPTP
jgi:MFS transporter, putative metabolite:H+ symporter